MLTMWLLSLDVASAAMVINPLDDHQQRTVDQDESAKRRSKTVAKLQGQICCDFTPLSEEECLKKSASHFLSGCAIGPVTTTSEDIAARTALRKRYLGPHLKTQPIQREVYEQAQGASFLS